MPLPELRRLSDVQFLEYHHLCQTYGDDIHILKWIFRVICPNETTAGVVDKILAKKDYTPSEDSKYTYHATEWVDRLLISPGSDELNAILGTPNGSSVAWVLFQHREALGHKAIKDTWVFKDVPDYSKVNIYRGLALRFEIGDLEVVDSDSD